jgi:hypothetical protein
LAAAFCWHLLLLLLPAAAAAQKCLNCWEISAVFCASTCFTSRE